MPWTPAAGTEPVFAALAEAPTHRGRPDPVIVEGAVPVQRAIEAGLTVHAVAATATALTGLPTPAEPVPAWRADAAELAAALGYPFRRGCVAIVARPAAPPLSEALTRWAGGAQPVVVVAEQLADPVNVGAVLRNARAFGAAGVVFVGGADPLTPRAIRSSVGHVFGQPWTLGQDPVVVAQALRGHGFRSWAATVAADAVDIADVPGGPVALWLGTEGPGLSARVHATIADRTTVPIAGDVDSLNVAAASAVMLHVLTRRPSATVRIDPGRGATDRA